MSAATSYRWAGPFGRVIIVGLARGNRAAPGLSAPAIGEQTIPTFLGLVAAYTALVWVVDDRRLSRVDDWLAAIVLLSPFAALTP